MRDTYDEVLLPIPRHGTTDALVTTIRSFIADRGLQPGDRIGAEREIAQTLGVSRWAIRRALEYLEHQEEILRTHGRNGGVFAAPKKLVRSTPLAGLPRYLQAQGVETGTTVLGTQAGPPDDESAKQLALDVDAWIFHIERLRLADGLPLVLERAHFPCDLFPGLLEQSLGESLYDILETRYDIDRGVAIETITATAASREVAGLLQVSVGAPLISITRTTQLDNGRPFEYSHELYRSDRTAVTVRSDGESAHTTIEP
uniref:GntR family transcriptional regulator n=1 Tax=Rhodococcus sp. T104 TaxID=230533 RepID=B6VJI0_9NOCA|nr:GntR family transcriptional regulator [Rhodococcus sp. T104]